MKAEFHKISIDFEYFEEIYTINSDPYKTLSELKDIALKKIFPCPDNVHCFYKNMDLTEKEDEEIAILFPHFSKIKLKLKNPPKQKSLRSSILNPNQKPSIKTLENVSKKKLPEIDTNKSPELKNKTIRKKNLETLNSLPTVSNITTIPKNVSRDKMNKKGRGKTVKIVDNNIKNNELFFLLNNNGNNGNNDLDTYKSVKKEKKEKKEVKNSSINDILDKYKSGKNNNFISYKKEVESLNLFLSNLKRKNLNKIKLANSPSLNFIKKKTFDNNYPKTENKKQKINLKALNLSLNERYAKDDNIDENSSENEDENNNNKNSKRKVIIDDNYKCSSCLNEIISLFCFDCNEFKCKTCIELCKVDEHKFIEIELKNWIKNIISFGELVISNIDKNLEEISKYDKEIQIYDVAKYKNNLMSRFNEILILYNEIINILQNVNKENQRTKEMNDFAKESNKIKKEINDILKNANSYLKNDEDISKPKYKMMNMKYFFDLINEKRKAYNTINDKMKKYSLNLTINTNIEKRFSEIDKIINSFSNEENPFSLEKDLKDEYQKLIQLDNNPRNDKKKLYFKRKTLSTKAVNLLHFKKIVAEKNKDLDLNNSGQLDL